jgi:MFS transporter, Spinster family, sphingosine-1-phosphate transporter
MHPQVTITGRQDGYLGSKPQAWLAFSLAFLLMTFDFIDRQVIVSLFPHLKADWGLSDKQLGALVSAISITIAVASLPLSIVIDRWSRVKSIVVMGLAWSSATIACAFCTNYGQLLPARSMIGLGEAGYGPAGAALITTLFPSRLRATVVGGFLAAASLGSVLGVLLGGFIAVRWGWHAAFGIVGVPGVVLALLFLLVRDYETLPLDAPSPQTGRSMPKVGWRRIARELFRARSGIAAYLGGALQLITVSTLLAWLPSYFHRYYGVPADRAGVRAALVIIAGTAGILAWGYIADLMSRRNLRHRLLVPAACALMTLALLSTAFGALPPGNLQFVLILAGGFTMTASTGPIPAVAIDVVHPCLRASAGSMVAVAQNLFGLGVGPLIAGSLSDAYGLKTALALIPLCCLLAAIVLIIGATTYEKDRRLVADIPLGAALARTGAG